MKSDQSSSLPRALLFIAYVNDISDVLDKCEVVLYSEDTLIYTKGSTSDDCDNNMVI